MERLTIKDLGPINNLQIDIKPLTVLFGKQGSGKSLVVQSAYFFKALKILLVDLVDLTEEQSSNKIARKILDGIRGSAFGYFANGKASISFTDLTSKSKSTYEIEIVERNRQIITSHSLEHRISRLLKTWQKKPDTLKRVIRTKHIFVPTERSAFTRLFESNPGMLMSQKDYSLLAKFAEILAETHKNYISRMKETKAMPLAKLIEGIQKESLGGNSHIPKHGPRKWKWRIANSKKILPIHSISSGQMDSWPFFRVAATYIDRKVKRCFYIEEPETHLHPEAQAGIAKVFMHLINNGHQVMVTTHSPFLVYELNNLILAHKAGLPDSIDPAMVGGANLSAADHQLIDSETGLIKCNEFEDVAASLNEVFEKNLGMAKL